MPPRKKKKVAEVPEGTHSRDIPDTTEAQTDDHDTTSTDAIVAAVPVIEADSDAGYVEQDRQDEEK